MRYRLSKKVISNYIRTNCQRRLRLDLLAGKQDALAEGAPPKDSGRPGLALLAEQGRAYERKVFAELEDTFGSGDIVRGELRPYEEEEERVFDAINLSDHIDRLRPDLFVLEVGYKVEVNFQRAYGLDALNASLVGRGATLEPADVRPDIIWVMAPMPGRRTMRVDGTVEPVPDSDGRLGLKVIDIKSSGEASPGHFAELAYYGMTLAAWLEANGKDDRFLVLADHAIWPGTHEGSTISRYAMEDERARVAVRDMNRYRSGLCEDLDTMPPEVVCGRVSRFLTEDLVSVLKAPDWKAMPFHVDHRCQGCDYLGFRWSRQSAIDDRYCWPTAEREHHLSRLKGLTEGACGKLRDGAIDTVIALQPLNAGHPIFENHQALRASRTVIASRAKVLEGSLAATIPTRSGTSAIMPRYADIRVAVSVDYDVGSGLTFAFGYQVFHFGEVVQADGSFKAQPRRRNRPLLVEKQSIEEEGLIFVQWLDYLIGDIRAAEQDVVAIKARKGLRNTEANIQFFLWDTLAYEHLCKVMGRHLLQLGKATANAGDVSLTSWLFPSERTLMEADFVERESPITIVGAAIDVLLAAPVPHHYSLVEIANLYFVERAGVEPWKYQVNNFYMDPLSDQIPSERGHEVWMKESPFRNGDYQSHREIVRKVVVEKLSALQSVVERLTKDLGDKLTSEAPTVGSVLRRRLRLTGVPADGQIIFQHSRLLSAAKRMETDLFLAMPTHEREARFKALRLEGTLSGTERTNVLRGAGRASLDIDPGVFAFQVRSQSRDVKIKEGDYLWSLMPEDAQRDMSNWTVRKFKDRYPLVALAVPFDQSDWQRDLRQELRVEIKHFDRVSLTLIVATDSDLLRAAVRTGAFNLNFQHKGPFGVLDPVSIDFFTRPKLKPALEAIRTPALSITRPLFSNRAMARVQSSARPRITAAVVPENFIWNADALTDEETGHDRAWADREIEAVHSDLTPRQKEAVRRAFGYRLTLWWGPPGTGKSKTAVALIGLLVADAVTRKMPVRICVSGHTWVSIENVLAKLPEVFRARGWDVKLARLASRTPSMGEVDVALRDHVCVTQGADFAQLSADLIDGISIVVVGTTADQASKLGGNGLQNLFDFMLIDEASQMDVAHSIVAFTKLAPGASLVVIGDDRQMAPIHQIPPPVGSEHMLGSIYSFYARYRGTADGIAVKRIMLDRNFRSNREIVDFVREAGYGADLHSANPDLRIGFQGPTSVAAPSDWPQEIPWCDYDAILDPDEPLVAIVHSDGSSSQRNQEEADIVVGLVLRLYRRGLLDLEAGNAKPYSADRFFADGVGVVTPHRAQQAAILNGLMYFMPGDVDRASIHKSVDTVERFQGQEKAVMIASFGLGDRDQIGAEETFLYSLNRFNVIASRAKAKLIVFMSRRLVDHLPRDRDALEQSRLLKLYADGYLRRSGPISLPGMTSPCEMKLR